MFGSAVVTERNASFSLMFGSTIPLYAHSFWLDICVSTTCPLCIWPPLFILITVNNSSQTFHPETNCGIVVSIGIILITDMWY